LAQRLLVLPLLLAWLTNLLAEKLVHLARLLRPLAPLLRRKEQMIPEPPGPQVPACPSWIPVPCLPAWLLLLLRRRMRQMRKPPLTMLLPPLLKDLPQKAA
jgi:hypothetical protein